MTQETQWDPPDEAYIPVSLDSLGYEMVEGQEEEGGGEEEYAEWEWDEDKGQWVYKGEGQEENISATAGGEGERGAKRRADTATASGEKPHALLLPYNPSPLHNYRNNSHSSF